MIPGRIKYHKHVDAFSPIKEYKKDFYEK